MRSTILIITFFALTLTLVSCAYTTQSALPENIKTIEVSTFGNTTYYNELDGNINS